MIDDDEERFQTVRQAIAELPAQEIISLAARHVMLVAQLQEPDLRARAAVSNRDVTGVQEAFEDTMSVLIFSIYRSIPQPIRKQYFGGHEQPLVFETIESALRAARLGHRHWLTMLQDDFLSTSSKDLQRSLIEGRAAVMLDVFGQRPQTAQAADKIAARLVKSGFKTKRGAPKGSTVRGWLKQIRQLNKNLSSDAANPSNVHKARLHWFNGERPFLGKMKFEDALDLLEHHARMSVPKMIGSEP